MDKPSQPTWRKLNQDSFDTLGLLAERKPDGSVVCNLVVSGGFDGEAVVPEWGCVSGPSMLLAQAIARRMFELPTQETAPMRAFITEGFAPLLLLRQLQCDGTPITAASAVMAKRLCERVLATDKDYYSLSLDLESLIRIFSDYINESWPSRATPQSQV
jgi:hypothetical protein